MAGSEFYIYVLFRETGVPFYVGKGRGDRWTQHEWKSNRENPRKRAIIEQILVASLEVPKIKLHEGLTEATATAYEIALIAAIGREDNAAGPLVNMTAGGEGITGYAHTPEHRARMSARQQGQKKGPQSAKHRAKLSELARNRSPEHAAKLREAAQNRSPEWFAAITAAARNRPPGWRMKLSATRKGQKNSPEAYAKGAETRRGQKRGKYRTRKLTALAPAPAREAAPPAESSASTPPAAAAAPARDSRSAD